MNQQPASVPLGKTDIRISPLGVGAWAWGDRMIWGYGRDYNESDIRQAFEVSLEAGVNFFDTAETYAQGRSERYLGKFMAESGNIAVTATKFMPFPWRLSKSALPRALRDSLERLDMQQVDLYQLHWPLPPVSIETWADALADVVEAGLARAVGVSNYNEAQMRRAYSALARRGVPLASNQAPYHLLNRKLEFDGTLATCRELGITLIAYSPLAQGALTGKYTPQKPLPGLRGRRVTRAALENIQPLIRQMREIGRAHDGKTPAQVALNWLICKGAVPIPGAKNARQAQENASALGWSLSEGEVAVLDEISAGLA